MTAAKKKTQVKRNSGLKTAVAVATGAIVGAGIAVVGTMALKDKKNREKVKQVLRNVKDRVEEHMEKAEKKVVIGKRKVKKITKLVKDTGKKVSKR